MKNIKYEKLKMELQIANSRTFRKQVWVITKKLTCEVKYTCAKTTGREHISNKFVITT
jgi:hypothetical protein